MTWYALYTKPRWEKKVTKELQKIGIETYCPMVTEVKQWSDRKKKVTSPLFKSYVFVHIAEKHRARVFEVPGVVQYLYWLGKPAIIRDSEIEILEKWLQEEEIEDIEVGHINPGEKITIAGGSFKGQEATVSKVGKKRLRLILKNLGLVVNVKVSDALEK